VSRKIQRRVFMSSAAAVGVGVALAAGPAARGWAQGADDRRLARRLELWATYATKTENLTARYTSTRTSSLLHEPLVNTGALVYAAPDTLAMVDDAMGGSRTIIRGGRVQIAPRQADETEAAERVDPRQAPGLLWLKDRLLACFSPEVGDEGDGLVTSVQAHAPRGRRPRIELRPDEGSPVRKLIRVVIVQLDPVGGAVVRIQIDEAQGDSFVLALADHRQNVDATEIERVAGA